MPRFEEPQDPLFAGINASIGFDRRLWREDVRGSRAHAAGARARRGHQRRRARRSSHDGLDAGRRRARARRVRVRRRRRGHPHGGRAPAHRDRSAPLGGKLHTGRSRNDQVATDLALYVRERGARARRADRGADGAPARARRARTATGRCPATPTCSAPSRSISDTTCSPTSGCSRATRAAFAAALTRPRPRCRSARARSPASTGTSTATATAAELGFAAPAPNSIDAVSNRDFALDYLYAAAVCATHLSRLGGELVIWSSQEFGFCEPADDFSSGSSIMPQKKNPDAAELLRAKAPRVAASLTTLLGRPARAAAGLLQGPAGGQGGAVRRRRHDRALARGRRADARRDALRPRAARRGRRGRDGRGNRRRRPAGAKGDAVSRGARRRRRPRARARSRSGAALSELDPTSSPRTPSCSTMSTTRCWRDGAWLESKLSAGGTASARVAEQLDGRARDARGARAGGRP